MKGKRIHSILMTAILICSILLCVYNANEKSMETEYADRTGENRQKEDVEQADGEADADGQIETPFGYPSMPESGLHSVSVVAGQAPLALSNPATARVYGSKKVKD